MAITLDTSQGNCNSADPSSSVSGTVVTIVPRLTQSEGGAPQAGNVSFTLLGSGGTDPTIHIPASAFFDPYLWGPYEWGYWSPANDLINWTRMGLPVSFSSGDIILQNGSNFPGDVCIARDRLEGPTQVGAWASGLLLGSSGLVWQMAPGVSVGAELFKYSPQTDELGRTVARVPCHGFIVANTDPTVSFTKPVVFITTGAVSEECWGTTCCRAAVDWLVTSAPEAVVLRNKFNFVFSEMNSVGRWAGHFRAQFQVVSGFSAGSHNDLNRHYSDTTNLFETVTQTKAFALDTGFQYAAFFAYQGYSDQSGSAVSWYSEGSSLGTPYDAAIFARIGGGSFGALPAGTAVGWAIASKSAQLAKNFEFNSGYPSLTLSDAATRGPATILALYDLVQAGYYGSSGPTASPFGRRAV